MDNYTHTFRSDLDKAVDDLPDWHALEQGQVVATGTDNLPVHVGAGPAETGGSVLARRWAREGTKTKNSVESNGALATQRHGEENPMVMRETPDSQGIGRGRIRTCEGISQRIYSPSLLAAQAHARFSRSR